MISGLVAGLVTNPVTASVASAASSGATATYAEPPGTTPNYILPLLTGAYYSVANIEQFQRLSYRSLFWIGDKGEPVVNPVLSLANSPTYSPNDTVVNITLRKYNWSDGTPVTSRDVTFWINLLEANKKNIAFYIPGEFPDNLKSFKATGPESVQLTLTGAVNPTWFTYDQLSQITPIPQQTWDRTSASGAIGNYDQTPAGAVQVFNFLTAQSKTSPPTGRTPCGKPWTGRRSSTSTSRTGTYSSRPTRPTPARTPMPSSTSSKNPSPPTQPSSTCSAQAARSTTGLCRSRTSAQSGALKSEGYTQECLEQAGASPISCSISTTRPWGQSFPRPISARPCSP